jgi:hypothetical protein
MIRTRVHTSKLCFAFLVKQHPGMYPHTIHSLQNERYPATYCGARALLRGSFIGVRPRIALLAVLAAMAMPLCASPEPPSDLKEAVARLGSASSPADYAAKLDAYSSSLSPSDSIALLNRCLASVGTEFRGPLIVKAGGYDLLLGLFGEAASRYEEAASGKDGPLLLRAARCYLAAGEPEKASAITTGLILGTTDPALSADARLVGAWSLVLQGRPADALAIAAAILGQGEAGPGRRREARFILWLCSAGPQKAEAASALAADFPGSPEASISSGTVFPPPLPHWYLAGLSGDPKAPGEKLSTSAIVPGSAVTPDPGSAPKVASAQRAKRLQVGYFSLAENAQALKDELLAKRFAASIEAVTRAAGPGKPEAKRWIVVVEGGKDLAKTMQDLKDSGFESYIVD